MTYWFTPEFIETVPNLSTQVPEECKIADKTLMGRHHSDGEFKNIVFLGYENVSENSTYKTLLMNYMHSHSIFWVDLANGTSLNKAEFLHNKFLMQRYNLIEQAKEANIIGIIMGTLSVKGSAEKGKLILFMHRSR